LGQEGFELGIGHGIEGTKREFESGLWF
jgi:hypothetical protein